MKQVRTVAELNQMLDEHKHEFVILLNGGVKSSKYIDHSSPGHYYVLNYIEYSVQILSEEELFDETLTNIGRAMQAGAFFCDV